MKGTVKFFNRKDKYGFITAEDGKDYFVHISALPEGEMLNENDSVEFEVEEGERGPKAVNVRIVRDDQQSEPEAEVQEDEEEAEE